MFLGNSQKGSLDLTGALVEIDREPKDLRNSNQSKIKWIIKISTSNACTPLIVGTESLDDAEEWKNLITETAHNASARVIFQIIHNFIYTIYILIYFLYLGNRK